MDLRSISLRHRSLIDSLGNVALDDAGLAEGTNANTFKTANAMDFTIKGRFYSKAATDNIAFATAGKAFTAQADLSTAYYVFLIDSAGAITVLQGLDSTQSPPKQDGNDVPGEIPHLPDNLSATRAVFGILKVVTSGGTFTPGTTDLGAAAVTDTFYDVAGIPPGGAADLA